MAKISFPIPDSLEEALELISKDNRNWWEIEQIGDEYLVFAGDKEKYRSKSLEATEAFLWAVFLCQFGGRDLEYIQQRTEGKTAFVPPWKTLV